MFELFVVVGGLFAILLVSRRVRDLDARLLALETFARQLPPPDPAGQGAAPIERLPGRPAAEPPPPEPLLPPKPALPPRPAPALPAAPPAERPGAAALPPSVPPKGPSGRGFEEMIGSRWAVWVGGLALGLGGIFLVRYSIEQDLIGPRVRVAMGLLLALALLAAGEWLRRRETPLAVDAFPSANIPAILTAAGTSTAFAALYTAYALYGLLGPTAAFVSLGLVALVTMGSAMLHGPALAGLGLVAALGSPLLVESRDPSPVALVVYLAFAAGSAYAVSRLRLWRWLALSAAAGGWLWGCLLLVMGSGWVAASAIHLLVQLAFAILFLVVDPYRRQPAADAAVDRLAAPVVLWFAFLAAIVAAAIDGSAARFAFLGVVVAMTLLPAIRYPAGAPALAAAAVATAGGLLVWRVAHEVAREPTAYLRDLPSAPMPEALATYLTAALILNGAIVAAALLRFAGGRELRPGPSAWYAGAATLGPLASLVFVYGRVTAFDRSVPFALAAAALGAAFAAAAAWFRRLDPAEESPALRFAVGAFASAAIAALAAGLTFAFDKGVLTVALALSALGTAFIADRTGVAMLRYAVGALGIAVAGRLAWDPTIVRGDVGPTLLVNWLLWGYGVPALAFGLATHILARQGRDWVVRFVESLSLLFAALLVFLEIRHALYAGRPFAPRSSLIEAGLTVTEMLGFTLLAIRLDRRAPDILYRAASLAFGVVSIVGAALALGVRYNPFLNNEPVLGGAVFNSLLPAYLIPAVLAAAVAITARRTRPRAFVLTAAALALCLELAYAFLEVRRLFHDNGRIDFFRSTSQAELWCYTLVLIVNGVVLLGLGIVRDWSLARLAAMACLAVAVLKVFLVDLSALDGLARAMSFVGLGLALVAIGFVYQRLLAARSPRVT